MGHYRYAVRNGFVAKIQLKTPEENCSSELTVYHCIIHKKSLCVKILKVEHVLTTVMQTVNFITAKGLDRRTFQFFLWDIPYYTGACWLSRGKVLSRVLELSKEICQLMESKGKESVVLSCFE